MEKYTANPIATYEVLTSERFTKVHNGDFDTFDKAYEWMKKQYKLDESIWSYGDLIVVKVTREITYYKPEWWPV